MNNHDPKHVLIAGGGVAALEAALALRALAEDRVEVELLAPEPLFWYRPLAVAEPFKVGKARHFRLSELAAAAGAMLTTGALAAVDPEHHLAHTFAGADLPYDFLLIASGVVAVPAFPGALTFRGPVDAPELERVLTQLADREIARVVFAVPSGATWTLAAYELALLTAEWVAKRGIDDVELTLVTPEEEPLRIFGAAASAAVAALFDEHDIELRLDTHPVDFHHGELHVMAGDPLSADRVVALPRLRGRRIDGIAQTAEGFTPVDTHGRVFGALDVYAAGDGTSFPVKQGGIATQQADAAAESIAAEAGADVRPTPFTPVLRGLLLTGRQPLYLRREVTQEPGESLVGSEPLWWPPAKIVGRHLAPFLGALAGIEIPRDLDAGPDALPVHVAIDVGPASRHDALRRAAEAVGAGEEAGATAADAMERRLLLVQAGDTLADTAAQMRELELEAALVVEEKRLVGILTARDVLRAVAARVDAGNARVRHFMTVEPLTVSTGTSASAAVFLMTEYGVHHLPVMDADKPVGMITIGEATRVARRRVGIGLGF